MRCDNMFCIYCEEKECLLKEISLNNYGCCNDCIYIEIDSNYLKNLKNKTLVNEDKKGIC